MYADPPARLFQRGHLRDFLEQRLRELGAAIESFDRNRLLSASVEELTNHLTSQYQLAVPQLRRDAAELEHQEVEIDPARFGPNPDFWYSEGARIKGIRYTLHVPFEGDAVLFEFQPSQYTMSGAPIAAVKGVTLVVTVRPAAVRHCRLGQERPERRVGRDRALAGMGRQRRPRLDRHA